MRGEKKKRKERGRAEEEINLQENNTQDKAPGSLRFLVGCTYNAYCKRDQNCQ